MTNKEITTYLKDHFAGSVSALELIEHLIKRYRGQELESFFADLYREIKADQEVLRGLLGVAGKKESLVRNVAAWLTEKFARVKFKIAGQGVGGLGLLQALETLDLGIRGKQLLWRALAVSNWSAIRDLDLTMLEQRAIDQQRQVEERRLSAARAAFS